MAREGLHGDEMKEEFGEYVELSRGAVLLEVTDAAGTVLSRPSRPWWSALADEASVAAIALGRTGRSRGVGRAVSCGAGDVSRRHRRVPRGRRDIHARQSRRAPAIRLAARRARAGRAPHRRPRRLLDCRACARARRSHDPHGSGDDAAQPRPAARGARRGRRAQAAGGDVQRDARAHAGRRGRLDAADGRSVARTADTGLARADHGGDRALASAARRRVSPGAQGRAVPRGAHVGARGRSAAARARGCGRRGGRVESCRSVRGRPRRRRRVSAGRGPPLAGVRRSRPRLRSTFGATPDRSGGCLSFCSRTPSRTRRRAATSMCA